MVVSDSVPEEDPILLTPAALRPLEVPVKKVKVCFYIAQYPFRRNDQSSLSNGEQ